MRRADQFGFTMFETIIVFALLTAAALALFVIMPRVFQTQTTARDEFVGVELLRMCAERVLDVRRSTGFTAVNVNLCANLNSASGGPSGWNAPVVALSPSAGSPLACTTSPCTATITVTKASGIAAPLAPITVQLLTY